MNYSELKEAIMSTEFTQTYHISDAIMAIAEADIDGYITEEQGKELIALIGERQNIRNIVSGSFTEGSKVTVNINGEIVTRTVRWSDSAKDLFITFNNAKYFCSEFNR